MGDLELVHSQDATPGSIADRAVELLHADHIEPSVVEDLIKIMTDQYSMEWDDHDQCQVRNKMTGNIETPDDFSRRILTLIYRRNFKAAVESGEIQVH